MRQVRERPRRSWPCETSQISSLETSRGSHGRNRLAKTAAFVLCQGDQLYKHYPSENLLSRSPAIILKNQSFVISWAASSHRSKACGNSGKSSPADSTVVSQTTTGVLFFWPVANRTLIIPFGLSHLKEHCHVKALGLLSTLVPSNK